MTLVVTGAAGFIGSNLVKALNLRGDTDIIAGEVHRIAATGSNTPPVARATATPSQGPPPLAVQP